MYVVLGQFDYPKMSHSPRPLVEADDAAPPIAAQSWAHFYEVRLQQRRMSMRPEALG